MKRKSPKKAEKVTVKKKPKKAKKALPSKPPAVEQTPVTNPIPQPLPQTNGQAAPTQPGQVRIEGEIGGPEKEQ